MLSTKYNNTFAQEDAFYECGMAEKNQQGDGLRQRKKGTPSKVERNLGESGEVDGHPKSVKANGSHGSSDSADNVDMKGSQETATNFKTEMHSKNNEKQFQVEKHPCCSAVEANVCIRCFTCCFCCCIKRRRPGGPWLLCGTRLSRRLRKPTFVIGLVAFLSLISMITGIFLGAISSLVIIHRMRVNTREFPPTIAGALEYMGGNLNEASRFFAGATSICYDGKGGQRPFSEHDGSYEDVSRVSVTYEVEEWYPKPVSKFQDLEVFRSKFFGKVLVIDDEIMITERDETHYHEMLAHVPLAYAPEAVKRQHRDGLHVLIIGGGDGGTLTQVLRHSDVVQATIIELDPAVVAASREHFPHLALAYEDPRVTLLHENGAKWVAEYAGLEYFEDSELDAAFDKILGGGDERTRATRMPVINKGKGSSHRHASKDKSSDVRGERIKLKGQLLTWC